MLTIQEDKYTSGRVKITLWLWLAVSGVYFPTASLADPAVETAATADLETWRSEIRKIRILVDNDVLRAYAEAQALLNNVPENASPADRAAALNILSRAELNYALTEQAENHARQALELARQYNDAVGQAEAWINLSFIAINQADIELIKTAPEQALLALEGVQDRPDLLGEAMLLTTSMYLRFGKLEEAVTNALDALEIAKQEDDPFMLTRSYRAMAIIFSLQHRQEEAVEYYSRMREHARTIPSRILEAQALNGIASAMTTSGDVVNAEAMSRQALALFREAHGPFYLCQGLWGLAEILHNLGRDAEAISLLDEALAIQEQHDQKLGVWWSLFNRSTYSMSLGDLDASMADAERTNAIAKEIGLPLYLEKSTRRIAEIYSIKGEFERAYEYAVKDLKIKDQAEQIQSSQRLLELAQRYREESKQRKIDALEQQSRLQEAELRQRQIRLRWLLIVLGVILVALAVTAWLLWRLRQSHHLQQQINLHVEQSRNELRKQTSILQSILDSMSDGVAVANERGELMMMNPIAQKIIGVSHTTSGGRILSRDYGLYLQDRTTLYPEEDLPLLRAIRGESCDNVEIYACNPAIPEGRWLSVSARPLKDKGNITRGGVAVFSDISSRKRAQEQMELSAKVFEQSAEGIIICDADKRILSANRAFCEMTGYTASELLDKHPVILHGDVPDKDYYRQLWRQIWEEVDQHGYWQGEIRDRRKNGETLPTFTSITSVRDERGRISNYISISRDITQHKQTEEHIHRLAYFDALTELPNRTLLNDRIDQALTHAQRGKQRVALMFLDLDRFKNINDSLGHRIGDNVLVETARRLEAVKRGEDTVSRLGGDEFILLLSDTDSDGAAHVAEKVLQAFNEPFHIGNHELSVTTSIGISIYPDDGEDADTLIQNADTAMYRAKQDGRDTFRFFTPEMYVHASRVLHLENALRNALAQEELSLHYQPQVDIITGEIIGCEALLRWEHPKFGRVSPAEFIPIAEDSGQILPIGEWVMRNAVKQVKEWEQSGLPLLPVSVNLSVVQFRQTNLTETIQQILKENALRPEFLELELTESITMDDPVNAINIMNRLHQAGINLSIDDFGTGYSSLSYLKRLNIHKLKIDQSFVHDITVDPEDEEIVRTIIGLAKSFGLRTIAEGVETNEQLEMLKEDGCDEIQGYYFSKPLPADKFKKLFEEMSVKEKATLYSR